MFAVLSSTSLSAEFCLVTDPIGALQGWMTLPRTTYFIVMTSVSMTLLQAHAYCTPYHVACPIRIWLGITIFFFGPEDSEGNTKTLRPSTLTSQRKGQVALSGSSLGAPAGVRLSGSH